VRFGQDLLAIGRVMVSNTHSFASDKPWVNHEWLAEVAMARAYAAAGPIGLNLLRIACLGAVIALIWRRLARFDPPARRFDAVLVVATLGVYARAQQVRPQLFSLLLFTLLLTILTDVDRTGDRRRLILIPPLMALWANLHGGWVVGLECLTAWAACRACYPRPQIVRTAQMIALVAIAALCTAANPYGIGLWRFVLETVRVGRPYIEEWQPVYRLQGWVWLFWLLPAGLGLVALIRSRCRLDPAYAVVVLMLATTSMLVNRLDAFFMLAAAFLLAEPLLGASAPRRTTAVDRSIWWLSPAAALIAIAAVPWLAARAARIQIGHPPMPEREAVEFVASNDLHGRLLVWFDWGEYVIWHFSPQLRVSIDGRRETVYSDRLIDDHMAFYLGEPRAIELPARIGADYIWVPTWIPVVHKLRDRGWTTIFEGPESTILSRAGTGIRDVAVYAVNTEPRTFPGP